MNKTSSDVLDSLEAGLSLNQYLENRMTNRASRKGAHGKGYEVKELSSVGFACKFHSIDGTYQLFRCMTDSNIVVLAFTYLFREVSAEVLIPVADIFCGIEQSIPQITRSPFFHVGIARIKLS